MSVAVAGLGPSLAAAGTSKGLLISVETQMVLEAAKLAELFSAVRPLASEYVVISLSFGVPMVRRGVLRALDEADLHLGCFGNWFS